MGAFDRQYTPTLNTRKLARTVSSQKLQHQRWSSSNIKGLFQLSLSLALYFTFLSFAIRLTLYAQDWRDGGWAFVAWLLVGLTVIRLFILQHDCTHRSLFSTHRLNHWVGTVLGIFCLTPHAYWRRVHLSHHRTSGNLDARGIGDIHTLTVSEYQTLSPGKKLFYRLYRNPWIILLVGPIWHFVVRFRAPWIAAAGSRERASIHLTNAVLALLSLLALWMEGGVRILFGYLTAMQVAGAIGILLFYVQHQYESVWWRRHSEWSPRDAAMSGSSHLVLPRSLEWMVAAINLHHVHHLAPWVPSYRLRDFMIQQRLDRTPAQLLPREIPRCLKLKLYDEATKRMVPLSVAITSQEHSKKDRRQRVVV